MRRRARIRLEGIVQGVGFRPFVHRLANSFNLSGWVLNSGNGLMIEVEGKKERVNQFYQMLLTSPPPMANIIRESIEFYPPIGLRSFEIKGSMEREDEFTPVSPDIGICNDCYNELFTLSDKRYRYPFINCTNCGPRFTIIKDIPYDRERTTMKVFMMCNGCMEEYMDISNRRYHAQPNACPKCGPNLWLWREKRIESEDPITEVSRLLRDGYIVAVKGLGGFHLCCNAKDDDAVIRLRKRKKREGSKPFAIMLRDLQVVRRYCELNEIEERILLSPKRPILLLKKKEGSCDLSQFIAPRNRYLGVMLPYTPLHHLLMENIDALIMTSGNLSDEPLTKDNDEAKERLSGIADYILMHNRDIYNRCDDTVTQVIGGKEVVIRRSRGYAPFPIWVDFPLRPVLSLGAELKNTFCLARGNLAFISQHIGDLKNLETLEFFKEGIKRYKALFRITPEIIAHDLHPDYLTTRFAKELLEAEPDLRCFPIQHHHAHIVSSMVENRVDGKVIGVAMDGIGYGEDGKVWGCEFMVCDYLGFKRVGSLRYVHMPGGDKATLEPFRMAISYLYSIYGEGIPPRFLKRWGEKRVSLIIRMIQNGINSPLGSSAGRLFDAVSSLVGLRDVVDYEAQAAMELEMVTNPFEIGEYGYEILVDNGLFIIDPHKTILEIIEDIEDGVEPSIISSRFHNTVIAFTLDICKGIREVYGLGRVVVSGGVFQNRYLLERIRPRLEEEGFFPILPSSIPPNDGGISLGQAVIASRRAEE